VEDSPRVFWRHVRPLERDGDFWSLPTGLGVLHIFGVSKSWDPAAAVAAVLCLTVFVYGGAVRTASKTVRLSVGLPATVAAQVRSLAKTRKLSANRMLLELIEIGLEAEKHKQQAFFDLAESFRGASNPDDAERLGDQLGRMVFGA
jgi:hypothetical protein